MFTFVIHINISCAINTTFNDNKPSFFYEFRRCLALMMNRLKLLFLLISILSFMNDGCLCIRNRLVLLITLFKIQLFLKFVFFCWKNTSTTNREPQINERAQESQPSSTDNDEIANQIALGVLNLSQQLTSKVLSSSTNKFEVLSPISIASALQLALLGAKGKTFDELRKVYV